MLHVENRRERGYKMLILLPLSHSNSSLPPQTEGANNWFAGERQFASHWGRHSTSAIPFALAYLGNRHSGWCVFVIQGTTWDPVVMIQESGAGVSFVSSNILSASQNSWGMMISPDFWRAHCSLTSGKFSFLFTKDSDKQLVSGDFIALPSMPRSRIVIRFITPPWLFVFPRVYLILPCHR